MLRSENMICLASVQEHNSGCSRLFDQNAPEVIRDGSLKIFREIKIS